MIKKTMQPDIWLQEAEESGSADCGCRLDAEYRGEEDSGNNGSPALFFCPLHAAAPKLLAVLKSSRRAIDLLLANLILADETFKPSESGKPWQALLDINAAIAQAEPPKEKEPGWFA